MTLHPIIQTIKRAAPEWARYFSVGPLGYAWWDSFDQGGLPCDEVCSQLGFPEGEMFQIDLSTGAIHLQSDDGTITVVSQDEWGAEGDDE